MKDAVLAGPDGKQCEASVQVSMGYSVYMLAKHRELQG